MKVSRDYLLCCANADALQSLGLASLPHTQPVSFYAGLVHQLKQRNPLGGGLVDDTMVFPTLEDTKEGEPSHHSDGDIDDVFRDIDGTDDSDAPDGDAVGIGNGGTHKSAETFASMLGTVAGSDKWGPFRFSDVVRLRESSGRVVHQIQCVCPFHHDSEGGCTRCTRTLQYNPGDSGSRELTVRMLKKWLLDGRAALHRAKKKAGELAHEHMRNVAAHDLTEDVVLNSQLREALMASAWIQLSMDFGGDVTEMEHAQQDRGARHRVS